MVVVFNFLRKKLNEPSEYVIGISGSSLEESFSHGIRMVSSQKINVLDSTIKDCRDIVMLYSYACATSLRSRSAQHIYAIAKNFLKFC